MGGGSAAATDDERRSLLEGQNKRRVQTSEPSAPEDKTKCQRMKSWCSDFFKNHKREVCYAALLIVIFLVNIARTVFVIMKRYQYYPCEASNLTNLTNHTNLTVNGEHTLGHPPPDKVINVYSEINVIAYTFLSLLHLPEYWCLFVGIISHKVEFTRPYKDYICQFKTWRNITDFIFMGLFLFLYTLLGMVDGGLATYVDIQYLDMCHRQKHKYVGYCHGILTIFVHIFASLARVFMVCKVIQVRLIFETDSIPELPIEFNNPKCQQQVASIVHEKLTEKYENVAKHVTQVVQVFSSWFLITWILYTLATVDELVTLIRVWMTHDTFTGTGLAYVIINVTFDFLTLSIPYICGLKLNSYHDKYYKALKERQQKGLIPQPAAEVAEQEKTKRRLDLHYYTTTLQINKRQDCDFVPGIWNIKPAPLDNALYVLALFVPTLALIWGFIVK